MLLRSAPTQGPDDQPPSLDTLAPELIERIYFQLDSLDALSNFITTSRYIHQCFKRRKIPVIHRVLQNALGPVSADAEFLQLFPRTPPSGPGQLTYWERTNNAAAVYQDMLDGNRRVSLPSPAKLAKLCRTFHEMDFLADIFLTTQLGPSTDTEKPPSRTERLRVLRAFYRHQIISNAWTPTRGELRHVEQDIDTMSRESSGRGVKFGLSTVFEPWELQQVDHVDNFVMRLCAALHHASEDAATASSPGPSVDDLGFGRDFSSMGHLARYMRSHRTLGDAALGKISSLRNLTGQEACVVMPQYTSFAQRHCLLCLRYTWLARRLEPSPQPAVESGGDGTVSFVGDAVDMPPFGWVDAAGGCCMNWFGDALHSNPQTSIPMWRQAGYTRWMALQLWRAAGFALWDRWRVEAIKELDQMKHMDTGWIMEEQGLSMEFYNAWAVL